MQEQSTIRLRVVTNKGLKFIIGIEKHKTINHLAKRLLNCYYELAGDNEIALPKCKLTITSIKYNNYCLSKSEIIQNLLYPDDLITCEIGRLKTLIVDQHRSQQQNKDYEIEPKELQIRQKLSLSKKISKKEKKKKKKILAETSLKQIQKKQDNKISQIIQPALEFGEQPMVPEVHESSSSEANVKQLDFNENQIEQEAMEEIDVPVKNETPEKEEESEDIDNFEIKQESSSSSVKESLVKSTKMEQKNGEDAEIRARIDSVDALLHKYDLGIQSDSE